MRKLLDQVVAVEWQDITHTDNARPGNEFRLAECINYGKVIRVDKEKVVVAHNITDMPKVNLRQKQHLKRDAFTIPWGVIKKVTILAENQVLDV